MAASRATRLPPLAFMDLASVPRWAGQIRSTHTLPRRGSTMQTKWYDNRGIWLTVGLIGGLCVAFVWPHERALAATADRNAQFALITVPVGQQGAGLSDPIEGVFVLDFLTGELKGGVLSRQMGKFVSFYFRNI